MEIVLERCSIGQFGRSGTSGKVTAMRCRCGNSINNVPDHLSDLATWVCQKCTNTVPKAEQVYEQHDESLKSQTSKRSKKAA